MTISAKKRKPGPAKPTATAKARNKSAAKKPAPAPAPTRAGRKAPVRAGRKAPIKPARPKAATKPARKQAKARPRAAAKPAATAPAFPARTTAQYQALDRAHHLHPFTDHKTLSAVGARVITRAKGIYLWDSEGKRIIDGMSGLWCVNAGYGQKPLVDAATRQMRTLPFYNTFFQTTHPPAIELSTRLARLMPHGLDRIFFAGSGSEANDTIVKMVRYYWNLEGKPTKKTIISRDLGYHGVTLATASMTGIKDLHPQADLPLPGFVQVAAPYWYKHGGDLSPDEFGLKAARALERKIIELGPDNVAAFIAEPIQGAGGVIVPPASYWPEIQRICKAYDLLLICDEVICGFGRTGKWFGFDRYAIKPDFVTMAKGLTSGYLPLAAIAVGRRVGDMLVEKGGEFFHGFTYSGHPVACAVAIENLRLLERERLVERAGFDIGPYMQRRLRETFADHKLVGEVRGIGMIAAIELVKDKSRRELFEPAGAVGLRCRNHCFGAGLIWRAIRDAMVMAPPLTISHAEIDAMIDIGRGCIDRTARDLGY